MIRDQRRQVVVLGRRGGHLEPLLAASRERDPVDHPWMVVLVWVERRDGMHTIYTIYTRIQTVSKWIVVVHEVHGIEDRVPLAKDGVQIRREELLVRSQVLEVAVGPDVLKRCRVVSGTGTGRSSGSQGAGGGRVLEGETVLGPEGELPHFLLEEGGTGGGLDVGGLEEEIIGSDGLAFEVGVIMVPVWGLGLKAGPELSEGREGKGVGVGVGVVMLLG